jgi:ribosomal protein S4
MQKNPKLNLRRKPLYKKFYHIYENVQFKKKLFNFRRQKWQKMIISTKKQLFFNNLNMAKRSSNPNVGIFFPYKQFFKKNYSFLTKAVKKLKLYYGGGYKKNFFRPLIKQIQKVKLVRFGIVKNYIEKDTYLFIEHMERRLESVLRRAFFFDSLTKIRQLIKHGHVTVNKKLIRNEAFLVKEFDLIEVSQKFKLYVKKKLKSLINSKSYLQPSPIQTNLIVNYRTFQVYYIGRKNNILEYLSLFPIKININKLLNFLKHK